MQAVRQMQQRSATVCVPVLYTARVFEAIQGHWLSACLGVMLDLKIADLLTQETEPIAVDQVLPCKYCDR